MRKRTKKLVAAYLLGALTATVGLETYHAIRDLKDSVAGIVVFLKQIGK